MPGTNRHRAVWRATPAEDLLDPGVRAVDLVLTTGCNLRCEYCYQQRGATREMAPEVLDAAIRRFVFSRLDRPRLTFFGGEPLLAAPLVRRALARVREWAPRRMKPEVRIFTNGTRLDEEMIHLLASRNVHITLSFDGVAPAQDDRSPGSFEILDRLLVRLRRDHRGYYRKHLAVKATLTSRNVPFLSASFRYFVSRGVRDVEFVPVIPDDAGWTAQVARELDRQLAEVVDLSIEEFRRSGEVPFRPFRSGATDLPTDGATPCGCGSRGLLFADVDGTLAPCAAFAPSTFGAKPWPLRRVLAALGGLHVTDPDLPAALIRRERRAHRLRFLVGSEKRQGPRGACARCKARPTCFVCPVAIACNRGRVPAFHCDVNRLFARHRAAFHRQTALHPRTKSRSDRDHKSKEGPT
jgi:sulfatase maturation enzyme AslB (radical SAM superfamily)